METQLTGHDLREQRLDEVIAMYLDDADLGEALGRQELLARCPDLAAELEAFFADRDCVDRLAAPLRQTSRVCRPACPAPPPQPDRTPTLPQGARVANLAWPSVPGYEVLGELGRGGMGIVYRATQLSLKRPVALKVLRAGATAVDDERTRFKGEAAAVARLRHPNIVHIYEVGEEQGELFFSLEFIEGGSLHQRLAGAPLEARPAAGVVQTLARAIQFAHERGIIHRDLKPANVLLAGSPEAPVEQCVPKVADFGLAKRVEGDHGLTRTGTPLGTPSYMAPEQARGDAKRVGPACDVYALGVILYECLTGRPPFKAASTAETLLQVICDEPISPRRLQPKVPRDLETICLKCLQKESRKRYSSALELAEDLRQFLAGEPIRARPARLWERAAKWARRRPAAAALVLVSGLALASLVGLVLGYNLYLRQRVAEAIAGEQQARAKADEVERGQALAALRAECRPLLEQAQAALGRREPEAAAALASRVQDRVRGELALADLKATADRLAESARRMLTAREDLHKLFRGRNDALFHLNRRLFTGLDRPDDLEAARGAARKALAPFGLPAGAGKLVLDDRYSAAEKERVTQGCYEVLLLLADATARPSRAAADPGPLLQALEILEQAKRLVPSTQVYHRRWARYLAHLGYATAARWERARAEAQPPAGPLDSFLVGAEVWLEEGNPKDALPHFQRAVRGQPDLHWPRFFLALAHLKVQQTARAPAEKVQHTAHARAELTLCIRERDDFVWGYLFRGFLNGELGLFEEAEADFNQAEPLATDVAARYVLHVNRGVMRIRQQRYPAAVAELCKAVALRPDQFHAHLNLAKAYQKQRKLDKARRHLDEAVRLKPKLALVYRERAHLHLLRNDPAAALSDFEQALRFEPHGPYAYEDHLERGSILLGAHRYKDTVRACKAALRLRPEDPAAHLLHAEALLKQKHYQDAVQSFDRYLKRGPAVVEVLRGRALAKAALGKYAAAAEDYTRALALRPKDVSLRTARGWAYLASDAAKLALDDFAKVIQVAPKDGDAYNGRGYALARLGRHADAVGDARKALELGPKNSRMLYNTARIFAQVAGGKDARGAHLDEALSCLAGALGLLRDDAERARFWREVIRYDRALHPIRHSYGYAQLEAQYHKPAK